MKKLILIAMLCNVACGNNPTYSQFPVNTSAPVQYDYAVQFCAGYQSTYPSTFPEIGLCIDGKLYANYWDGKNSWLTEVPPGYYASTSTTAPCNFVVLPGCKIQN